MSNSGSRGPLMVLMWLVTIGISIGSGIMAWDWIDPNSFSGAIGFLITWLFMSKVGHFYAMGFVAIVEGLG